MRNSFILFLPSLFRLDLQAYTRMPLAIEERGENSGKDGDRLQKKEIRTKERSKEADSSSVLSQY